ncbi:oligosaccharide flippase family protein [Vibrio alginolyticus]|jgi:O-antigen/teichoic acid export membrane protein|uniref:lipopolysaccharide biosynthesis protein n=1 Tax=Vibrio alginolyticus TaxID=663 RepID=UPI0006CA658F|nr:oligosaccharide flippase family protein [Vibrio alginolyticus]EGR0268964.1 oligosaccharide flippase family protein [Vibrio alginolyticus]KPM94190.1 polysaccharide biosynthesis protein [Vibrio alginolyticus]MBS9860659.1 oligosaccharide flippase family protein [Vibrio alginolyticus]MBS9927819.1 oligosaccharide flippase family protein [Vibrio alginolyticus]MBS9956437.1 oligosaccharide flippase family protein [Vibrio alginolyticus]
MSFAKNTYVYLFSNILNAAIPFILLPILTRYLSPDEYGQIAMFQTMLTGIGAFIGLNTVGAANRKFYDDNLSLNETRMFNGSCLQILIFTLFIATVAVMVAEGFLTNFLSIPSEWLYLALLVSSCTFLINFRLGQWQVRKSATKYGLLQVGNSILNMSLTLILIVFYDEGAKGRIDALLYAGVMSATIAIFLLYKDQLVSLRSINKGHIKEALNFGMPLVPHVFGAFLLTAADRFVINDRLGLADAGIYMVAVQVSMALNIVFDAINKAYVPWLFERLKRNDEKEKLVIVKNTYTYFLCVLSLAAVSFFIGPAMITLVVGDEYQAAGRIIGWLCLGQVFGGMYLMVTNYIFYAKKTGRLSLVTIGSGLLNLLTMLVLVNYLGIEGAAISFAFSKMIQFLLTWLLASKSTPMPWGVIYGTR